MPRASGDTPAQKRAYIRDGWDAPRKWGYTPGYAPMTADEAGCPAQVGIHLITLDAPCTQFRMPRASGDTPKKSPAGWASIMDAPRKWGYTSVSSGSANHGRGCPAQVGIHPNGIPVGVVCAGMPRASGDTPPFGPSTALNARDAPRKWGYTWTGRDVGRSDQGCPAQVGIHHRAKWGYRPSFGMPRASGDTPQVLDSVPEIIKDAPRKWGYTVKPTHSSVRLGDAPRKWGYTPMTAHAPPRPVGCPAQVGIHLLK